MSWGGSEKNGWFQLDVSISMLWSSSGESEIFLFVMKLELYRLDQKELENMCIQ